MSRSRLCGGCGWITAVLWKTKYSSLRLVVDCPVKPHSTSSNGFSDLRTAGRYYGKNSLRKQLNVIIALRLSGLFVIALLLLSIPIYFLLLALPLPMDISTY